MFAVAAALQHPGFNQRAEAAGQDVRRNAEMLLKLIKAGTAGEGIAQNEDAPPLPHPIEAPRDRASHFVKAFSLHRRSQAVTLTGAASFLGALGLVTCTMIVI